MSKSNDTIPIESATFRLVAQCLNQHIYIYIYIIVSIPKKTVYKAALGSKQTAICSESNGEYQLSA
jgi:hypothetical protein